MIFLQNQKSLVYLILILAPEKQFGVVAVSAGEGMADLFRELGKMSVTELDAEANKMLKEIQQGKRII